MSFFRLNFLPLNQHTFWHFFMVILHYGLRPRRNLIFWTLHRFTNINCKICFSVLSNPESNLLHIYDPRILHGQHTLVLQTLSSRNPESSQFCILFILRFPLDLIYHYGPRSSFEHLQEHCLFSTLDWEAWFFLLNIYMDTVYFPLWTENHDSFFWTFTLAL